MYPLSERVENAETLAHRIATGHAYSKHASKHGFSIENFEASILEPIVNASEILSLPRGRTAYWSDAEQMIVVHEPTHRDAGTAFRPKQGKNYFVNLRSAL